MQQGQALGRYQIVRLIGEGGMGTVYEAIHPGLKQHFAIKTLLPAFAHKEEPRVRFLREGEAASMINHPNVVSAEQSVDLLLPVMSAVATGHESGVIHRDLKPAKSPRSPLLSCPAGFACAPDTKSPGLSFCEARTGTGAAGSTCAADDDCTPGNFCAANGTLCWHFCYSNADCPSTSTCAAFASTPNYAGTSAIGYCTM